MEGLNNLSIHMGDEARAACAPLYARVLAAVLNLRGFSSGQTGFQNSTELGDTQVRPRILCYSNLLSIKCTRLVALALPCLKLFHHNGVYMTTAHASKVMSHATSVSHSHACIHCALHLWHALLTILIKLCEDFLITGN